MNTHTTEPTLNSHQRLPSPSALTTRTFPSDKREPSHIWAANTTWTQKGNYNLIITNYNLTDTSTPYATAQPYQQQNLRAA